MSSFIIDQVTLDAQHIPDDKINICSSLRDYTVVFQEFSPAFTDNDFVIIDKNICEIYNISHYNMKILNAIEMEKTIDIALNVCEWLSEKDFNKGNRLYVIGGGIIQDIGAFVGAMFKRGINWTYVPTTLLSQCDSCIGAKTALNFKNIKNQLALFSAPQQVIIDTKFLGSLSSTEILSGMGEIIKFFLLGGSYYLSTIQDAIDRQIKNGLSIKKAVIEYDEFEKNIRKSLNYGHSFGHAIEAASNYGIPHGEAVLLGIEIINILFTQSRQISSVIEQFTDIDKLKQINVDHILYCLKQDKKTQHNNISLVVVDTPGVTRFVDTAIDNNLKKKLYGIFAS